MPHKVAALLEKHTKAPINGLECAPIGAALQAPGQTPENRKQQITVDSTTASHGVLKGASRDMIIRLICQAARTIIHQYDIRFTIKCVNTKRNIADGAARADLYQRSCKALWSLDAKEYQELSMDSVHMWQELDFILKLNKVDAHDKNKTIDPFLETTCKKNGQASKTKLEDPSHAKRKEGKDVHRTEDAVRTNKKVKRTRKVLNKKTSEQDSAGATSSAQKNALGARRQKTRINHSHKTK